MKLSIVTILLLLSSFLFAQNLRQTITGVVIDKETHRALEGATISIADNDNRLYSVSDSNGRFVLNNVPVGRRKVEASYVGYQGYISDDIIISGSKAT
jgi:hypothetical protein